MRRSINYTMSLLAVAMLAGCNAMSPVTPTQGNGPPLNSNRVVSPAAHGFAESHRSKNIENLKGGGGGEAYSCSIVLLITGKAVGTFRGAFTGSGFFRVCAMQPGFTGSFAIASGSNRITGSFNGSEQGECGRIGCVDGGKLTYQATLEPGGKTFAGNGEGALRLFGSKAAMHLTLQSM